MKSYTVNIKHEFSELKEFAITLPETFDHLGSVIKDNRNIVKKLSTANGTFVIKNFTGMYFFNRLAYSLFRKSKAARSYIYSDALKDKGVITPAPVAWIDCYQWGMLMKSYFVSVYYPHETLQQILEYSSKDEKELLYHHLAKFAIRLHSLGVYHVDFSTGNILVEKMNDEYSFALVDLNRIKFQNVSYGKCLKNFSTLDIPKEEMDILISKYARLSDQSPEVSIDMFWMHKKRSSMLRRLRKKIRSFTLTPVERILTGR
jgi:hypothetical protein